jgi:hypothetical protein
MKERVKPQLRTESEGCANLQIPAQARSELKGFQDVALPRIRGADKDVHLPTRKGEISYGFEPLNPEILDEHRFE